MRVKSMPYPLRKATQQELWKKCRFRYSSIIIWICIFLLGFCYSCIQTRVINTFAMIHFCFHLPNHYVKARNWYLTIIECPFFWITSWRLISIPSLSELKIGCLRSISHSDFRFGIGRQLQLILSDWWFPIFVNLSSPDPLDPRHLEKFPPD